MSTSEIELNINAIDKDLKKYKERIDNIENYPKLKEHMLKRNKSAH